MTIQLNSAEAKAKLSELVAAAEQGETVVIARAGVPIVRLAPVVAEARPLRKFGILKEYGWSGEPTPDAAFAPDPETADALDADSLFPPEPRRP